MSSDSLQLATTCRTCSSIANDHKYFTPIFGESSCKSSKAEIFAELISFHLDVEEEDGLPQQICPNCIRAFEMVTKFRKRCKEVQVDLCTYFKKIRSDDEVGTEILHKVEIEILGVEETNATVSDSDLSDEDDISNWECEYYIESDQDDDISFETGIYITEDGQKIEEDMFFEDIEYIENTLDTSDIGSVKDANEQRGNKHDPSVLCSVYGEEGKKKEKKESSEDNSSQIPADFHMGFKFACTYCGSKYRYIYPLKSHLPICPKRPAVFCKICTVQFESKELHDKHIEEYHPDGGPPMCPICSCTFTDPRKRNAHIISAHRKPEQQKCIICERIFKTKNSLSMHKKRFHGVGNYECSVCHVKFTMTRKYRSHLLSHDENKNFKCQYCGKPFDSRHRAEIHERSHTGERPFLCNMCGLSFRYRTEFLEHIKSHTNHTDYKCEDCGKCLMSRKQLRCHIQAHHVCNICGRKFLTPVLKKMHKEQEHKNRNEGDSRPRRIKKSIAHPFNCSICSRGFNVAHSFAAHIKMHTEDRPHVCKECGSRFKRADSLQLHIRRVHLKIRSHTCEICGNKFVDRWALNGHMLVHSDETPFKCSECPRTFKRSCSLQIHMLKHTGDKPFACIICNRRYSCRKTLILHIKTHSKDQIKLVEEEVRCEVQNGHENTPTNDHMNQVLS